MNLSLWSTRIYFICTLALIALVYGLTLSPFLGPGDSGELIVDAYRLATPHPPGYPVYTFLAHLFTLLPFSTMAWRVALFSTLSQLAGAALLFGLIRAWLKKDWLASVMTLFFCFSQMIWHFAVEAEVFALGNFFAVLLLWSLYNYQDKRTVNWAYFTCLAFGLACTHHLTIILFAIPFFTVLFWQDRRVLLHPKVLVTGTLLFGAMLLPYIYLFYLGKNHLLISWGDLTNWDGFWTHVLRKEYGTFRLANSDKENSTFFPKLYAFAREMGIQTLIIGGMLSVWGVFELRRRVREAAFARLLFFALVFYVTIFQYLSNLDLNIPLYYHAQSRMWMLPLLLIVLLASWGVHQLHESWHWQGKTWVFIGILSVTIGGGLIFNWRLQDSSDKDFFERMGHTMLDAVEPNAVILMREDVYVNALRYLQVVDNVRPDVHVIPLDAMWWPWMKGLVEINVPGFVVPGKVLRQQPLAVGDFTLRQLIEANIDRVPLYISKLYPTEEQTLRGVFNGFPYGFHSRVRREGTEFGLAEVRYEALPFLNLRLPEWRTHRWESWETFVYKNYFDVKIPMAQVMVKHSKGRVDWLIAAADVYAGVAAQSADYRPLVLAQLGEIDALLSQVDDSYRLKAIQVWEELLRLNTQENEMIQKIRASLKVLKSKGEIKRPTSLDAGFGASSK